MKMCLRLFCREEACSVQGHFHLRMRAFYDDARHLITSKSVIFYIRNVSVYNNYSLQSLRTRAVTARSFIMRRPSKSTD